MEIFHTIDIVLSIEKGVGQGTGICEFHEFLTGCGTGHQAVRKTV